MPPYRRNVNTVFQHYALFPHMSVRDNVAFGPRSQGLPKAEIDQARAARCSRSCASPPCADRRPGQLSGGQQQRVALARALVNYPSALLLDEPLGALDLKLRQAMQIELKRIQRELGITFIYVTHDQEEALTMSDRIAVMNEGRVEQLGTPRAIYDEPETHFVATFIGVANLLPAKVLGTADGDGTRSAIAGRPHARCPRRRPRFAAGDAVTLVRPPRASPALRRTSPTRPTRSRRRSSARCSRARSCGAASSSPTAPTIVCHLDHRRGRDDARAGKRLLDQLGGRRRQAPAAGCPRPPAKLGAPDDGQGLAATGDSDHQGGTMSEQDRKRRAGDDVPAVLAGGAESPAVPRAFGLGGGRPGASAAACWPPAARRRPKPRSRAAPPPRPPRRGRCGSPTGRSTSTRRRFRTSRPRPASPSSTARTSTTTTSSSPRSTSRSSATSRSTATS